MKRFPSFRSRATDFRHERTPVHHAQVACAGYPQPDKGRAEWTQRVRTRLLGLLLTAGLVIPLPALAASVQLATSPLATTTTSSVSPNLMFILDDSGSMGWNYMPDNANDFDGAYGFASNQCNGVYYDPNITYTPPVDSYGNSYPDASFTAAWNDGYNTGAGTTNLNTSFQPTSSYTAGKAFYYNYSGTQTTAAQKDYYNTNGIFYKECNSTIGSTTMVDGVNPVNTLFTKRTLATTENTFITITGGATLKINSANSASVTSIKVNGVTDILSGSTTSSSTRTTVASRIATGINNCTAAVTGICDVIGYSATVLGDTVTIIGPAVGGSTLTIAYSGTMTYTATAFPMATQVSSIRVNGVELLLSGTTPVIPTSSADTLAASIAAGINATGYSATASGNVVTITGPGPGPSSAANYTPVITSTAGGMTLTPGTFPETDPVKLKNFANWYSYYHTRMLMMKTSTGLAFKPINDKYRVGFMTINNNVSPDALDLAPFWNNTNAALGPVSTQKADWYAKLYAATPNNSTPLREALAKAGRFYAHKLPSNLLNGLAVNDPIQYSCQQNFTILSTDGFWNGNAGYKLDGTAVGNQDGLAPRPMYDGGQISKTTSQVWQTQTQVTKSTSQIQKRTQQIQSQTSNLQSSTYQLQSITNTLQKQTSQLQRRTSSLQFQTGALQKNTTTDKWVNESGWANAASCTWDTSGNNQTKCRYAALSAVVNATGTCTSNDQSANTSNGTTWSGDRVSCSYSAYTAWANTGSCTAVAQSGSSPYSVLTAVGCQTAVSSPFANVSSCTVTTPDASGASTQCQYTANSTPANVGSCTYQARSAASPYTVGTETICSYSATPIVANVASCTDVAKTTSTANGTVWDPTAKTCSYTAYSAWANASSCTPLSRSTGSPYTVGTAANCQTTDTGWVNVASCTPGVTGGQTVTCQTNTTGPTPVASCTPVTAASGNNWTATSCTTTTVSPATLVASCTAAAASAANGYVSTTCNPVTTTVSNAASCTPQTAAASNGWTTVACSSTGGTLDTLADVAMYYYETDLRTSTLNNCVGALGSTGAGAGINVCDNNVFVSGADNNVKQHMTTLTLGLGARGRMVYAPDYLSQTSGDYFSVWKGSTTDLTATPPVCSWQAAGTACNWPVPASNAIENIDDLWHAAVDGRGTYFSATDPSSLATGLSSALSSISARRGAAAAAATSTLNPVAGDNYAYVASYTTVKWTGNLEARTINTATGVISEAASWCVENTVAGTCTSPGTVVADTSGASTIYNCVTPGVSAINCVSPGVFDSAASTCTVQMPIACTGTLSAMTGPASDTRTIYTSDRAANPSLVPFLYANLLAADFDAARIGTLSQWAALSATQKTAAEGENLVNFLRGQNGYEDRPANLVGTVDNRLYRYREAVFGDALESQPTFLGKPVFAYTDTTDPGYPAYATAHAGRSATVYVGANDGMLHAFNANTGVERWAYVPSMVVSNMWKLADKNYDVKHTNYVNGSPVMSDVCAANCADSASADWRTILVGGLNAGGRGYYALDVTDPAAPSLLWEFTTADDPNVGYSFGLAVITKMADGTWVVLVTSGYNNTSPGDGKGYLYVLNAMTGAIIKTIPTGVGSTTTPSGLAKIAAWNNVPASNQAGFTYGGDLLGNVWRFDINAAVASGTNPFKFAALFSDAAGTQPQSVTTTPVLGKVLVGGQDKRIIFVGTGKYLETSDLTDTQIQSLYAIKDDDETVTFVNPRASTVPPYTTPPTAGQMVKQTITTTGASRIIENTATEPQNKNRVDFSFDRGWYIDWPDSGERVNIDSKLVQGTLLVPTIVPSSTVCSPGGYGWFNYLDYDTGWPVTDGTGEGALGTNKNVSVKYDSTIVGFNVIYIEGKPIIEVVTSNDPTPHVDPNVLVIPATPKFSGRRAIWRELVPQ